ncbi:hypothetical protein Hypma_011113 [Hypsizygus marmoreus]|uniref:Uncharacterized protein n=1 Tax=Hypsizygus marmoreus TaxID=39966 RepID=A0A369JMW6_HYPMA|nr:hypothetical protein Hypma_011113 [Hypsizygus marmoreus]
MCRASLWHESCGIPSPVAFLALHGLSYTIWKDNSDTPQGLNACDCYAITLSQILPGLLPPLVSFSPYLTHSTMTLSYFLLKEVQTLATFVTLVVSLATFVHGHVVPSGAQQHPARDFDAGLAVRDAAFTLAISCRSS